MGRMKMDNGLSFERLSWICDNLVKNVRDGIVSGPETILILKQLRDSFAEAVK